MKKQIHESLSSVKNRFSNLFIWSVPLVAILFCGYLYIDYLRNLGPKITISFSDASGVQAEKTKVRYRGIEVGTVKSVQISEDSKKTLLQVRLNKDVKHFAMEGSKFWIVSPKVSFQGVAGLDTIMDGIYLSVEPAKIKGNRVDTFEGSDISDITESSENMSVFIIESKSVESIAEGNSITYRGLTIGSVSKLTLSKTGQIILIQINIENEYAGLIRTNTKFWRKVGINADVGLFGANIKLNSIESILKGGIALATPDKNGPPAKAFAHFTLEKEAPKDFEKWNPALD
jgi:paraquat-inducible protein B